MSGEKIKKRRETSRKCKRKGKKEERIRKMEVKRVIKLTKITGKKGT
jgi:hypothetical protein